jgi:hypothetical protein
MPVLPAYALHAFGRQLPIRGRLFMDFSLPSTAEGDVEPRNPMRAIFAGCCARAATGHAAAAPPITLTKSRRRIAFPKGSGHRQRRLASTPIRAGNSAGENTAWWSILRSSNLQPRMSLEGQLLALPRRSIAVRFTPMTRRW